MLVRRLRRLGLRREPGSVLLEGPRVVGEAAGCGIHLELLAIREGESFDAPADRLVVLTERVFASASQTLTPQGVLAIGRAEAAPVEAALAAAREAGWPLVVLDGVQDPGNVGAIARTAAAAGAPALVVLEGGADPFGAKAVRASAGNIFRLVVARAGWPELAGLAGWGAAADGTGLGGVALQEAGLIAFGSEARGLRRADLPRVAVPMAPGVESLNVAAAAAVLLFEIRRRLDSGC